MTERNYSAKVADSSRELTAKERVLYKDTSDCILLNDAVKDEALIINPSFWVKVQVHNENSENVDYAVFVIVDKDGTKYRTGSENFMNTFMDILEDMEEVDEDYSIKVYQLPSKNRSGQSFLTCSLV